MDQMYTTVMEAPQQFKALLMSPAKPIRIIGERLRLVREKAGWSQQRLADELGVSDKMVSKYEQSRANPSIDRLIQLHDIFGCSIDYLLGLAAEPYMFSQEQRLLPGERHWLDLYRRNLLPPEVMRFLEFIDTSIQEGEPPAIESGKDPKPRQQRTSKR